MKRLMLMIAVIGCLMVPAAVRNASAQNTGCAIDVSDVTLQLLRAQTLASSGDNAAGLAQIAEARAALAQITSVCADAGVVAGVLLDAQFDAPEGTFSVSYPAGWVVGNFSATPSGGGLYLGNSEMAAAALNTAVPQLQPGDQALVIAVGTADMFGSTNANPQLGDVLRAFTSASLAQFQAAEEPEFTTLENRPVGRVTFSSATFEAELVGLQLDGNLYAFVVGASAPGELDALRPVIDAVALSVR